MKLENLNKALLLAEQLKQVEAALKALSDPLKQFTANSPNWGRSSDNSLYQLHLSQYQDGSGFNVDLTGCCVGVQVLHFTNKLLLEKKSEIEKEIESL